MSAHHFDATCARDASMVRSVLKVKSFTKIVEVDRCLRHNGLRSGIDTSDRHNLSCSIGTVLETHR